MRALEIQSSSSALSSGRRLCLALRPAGRATSSGFARLRGCPGGAVGLRMLSKIGLVCGPFEPLREEFFLVISNPNQGQGV